MGWLGYEGVTKYIRAQDTVAVAHEAFDIINEDRTSRNMPALEWDNNLEELAIKHSQWMKDNDLLIHSDYKYAECILKGGDIFDNGYQVYHPWRDSYRHYAIIIDSKYRYGAVGIVGQYATLLLR